jgi:hypothetical protein
MDWFYLLLGLPWQPMQVLPPLLMCLAIFLAKSHHGKAHFN